VTLLLYYLCQVMTALLVFLPHVALLLYYLCQVMAALLVFLPQVVLSLNPVFTKGGQQLLPVTQHRSN
jgi:hypothetical protein